MSDGSASHPPPLTPSRRVSERSPRKWPLVPGLPLLQRVMPASGGARALLVRFTVRRAAAAWFALALWWYDTSAVAVREGYYSPAIRVDSASRAPIRAVACQAFVRQKETGRAAIKPRGRLAEA
jgi:hypothetical protein